MNSQLILDCDKDQYIKLPIPISALENAKNIYRECGEMDVINEKLLQFLANALLRYFNLDDTITIYFNGNQEIIDRVIENKNRKVLIMANYYKRRNEHLGPWISIYRNTPKMKIVSSKEAVLSLLHEIVHYVDDVLLGINGADCPGHPNYTPQYATGFNNRLNDLVKLLED